jgi:hypothetical protein
MSPPFCFLGCVCRSKRDSDDDEEDYEEGGRGGGGMGWNANQPVRPGVEPPQPTRRSSRRAAAAGVARLTAALHGPSEFDEDE